MSGKLIVISGPLGAGKTTLLKQMYEHCPGPLVASVSATTRPPRKGEVDGVDYHFLSRDEFARRREAGEFLECCEVYGRGDWYGTLKSEVTPSLAAGKWVVLEIDVQGTFSVLEHFPDAITIFIRPRPKTGISIAEDIATSLAELERRLRERETESEEAIQRRLEVARRELAHDSMYRFQVTNDDLDRAVRELCQILSPSGE